MCIYTLIVAVVWISPVDVVCFTYFSYFPFDSFSVRFKCMYTMLARYSSIAPHHLRLSERIYRTSRGRGLEVSRSSSCDLYRRAPRVCVCVYVPMEVLRPSVGIVLI